MRTGPGVGTSTGTGGVAMAVPLLTKGRAQAEGSNLDMNYFLGIDAARRVLVADFEDTADRRQPSGPGPHGDLRQHLVSRRRHV